MYICVCNAVTERQIHASVAGGARTLSDLQFELGVATCCGCCAEMATAYLPECHAGHAHGGARCESATAAAQEAGAAQAPPAHPVHAEPATFPVRWMPHSLARAA